MGSAAPTVRERLFQQGAGVHLAIFQPGQPISSRNADIQPEQ
jgi:hypothetical protein